MANKTKYGRRRMRKTKSRRKNLRKSLNRKRRGGEYLNETQGAEILKYTTNSVKYL
jgi:hypothetical protein